MNEEVDPWLAKLRPAPAAGSTASEEDPWQAKLQAPKKGTIWESINAAMFPGARDIASAVAGKNEFDFPEIATITGGADFDQRNMDFLRGEQSMVDYLRKQDPQLQLAKDKFDNVVVNFKGKPYYLNRSGLSERDARDFTRDMLIQLPIAAAATWATGGAALPIRMGAQALAGGAGSAAVDVGSRLAGGEQPFDMQSMLVSALGGAAGEAGGSIITGLSRRISERPSRYINQQTGGLTLDGARIVMEAGLDPADVGERVARAMAERVRTQGPTTAVRTSLADEFGIRQTPGQASGDPARQAFEQAAYNGARGQAARDAITPVMEDMKGNPLANVRGSVLESRDRLIDDLAPGNTGTRQDTADAVQQTVQTRYRDARARTDQLWEAARDDARAVRIPRAELESLPDFVRAEMRGGDPVRITDTLHPASAEAIRLIDEAGAGTIFDASTASGNAVAGNLGVTFEAVDSLVRKQLSFLQSSAMKDPGDRRAFGRVVRGYERWLDGLEDRALIAGAPDAIQNIRDARRASADLFQTFAERAPNARSGTTDRAGQTLERMIHDDVTSEEVASWLWGKSKLGESGDAYRLLRRVTEIIPPGSQEYASLRRGLLQTVLTDAPDKTQPGAQAMAQNLATFVKSGNGRSPATLLFTPAELSQLRRYAAALRTTIPDPTATNPSKSGYEMARAIIDTFSAGVGQPVRFFANATINLPNIARASYRNPPVVRPTPSAVVPAAAAVGAERQFGGEDEIQ